jgi:hypothetical protein
MARPGITVVAPTTEVGEARGRIWGKRAPDKWPRERERERVEADGGPWHFAGNPLSGVPGRIHIKKIKSEKIARVPQKI